MPTRSFPSWLLAPGRDHRGLLLAGVVLAVVVRLTRRELTELFLRAGTTAPFGFVPVSQWLSLLTAAAIAGVARHYGFGLTGCIGVGFALALGYFFPLSRPMGYGGPMIELVAFVLGFAVGVACLVGTLGFLFGSATRRLLG